MFSDQTPFAIRFDWGERGLEAIGRDAVAIVIVDVLSFCTCVELATARGAEVLPYRWRDGSAEDYAKARQAVLADKARRSNRFSLSPTSLAVIPPGTRLVLPSPNGSTLSLKAAAMGLTVAACLRNAPAVAAYVRSLDGPVAVIGCGEQWPDGSLRPAWEDMIGAGAVVDQLHATCSPEAAAARDAFRGAETDLARRLRTCSSGRELIERGFASDVELAAAIGESKCVPTLSGEAYVARAT